MKYSLVLAAKILLGHFVWEQELQQRVPESLDQLRERHEDKPVRSLLTAGVCQKHGIYQV